jgi:CheY-like chemotaxis protein
VSVARILVIDDERAVRDSLAKILRREGHEVRTASGGEEGLRMWREQGAAVVILDIHMPGFDGIEMLVQLRALEPLLPVIVISGGDQTHTLGLLGDAKLLGAVRALAKPFSLSEITAAVNHALGTGDGQAAG